MRRAVISNSLGNTFLCRRKGAKQRLQLDLGKQNTAGMGRERDEVPL